MAAKKKKTKRARKRKAVTKVISLATARKLFGRKKANNPKRARKATKKSKRGESFDEWYERTVGFSKTGGKWTSPDDHKNVFKNCGRPNPLRHFPKMPGRGRPAQNRKWDMVTKLVNGDIYEKQFVATTRLAHAKARHTVETGVKGIAVKEVLLDDGR